MYADFHRLATLRKSVPVLFSLVRSTRKAGLEWLLATCFYVASTSTSPFDDISQVCMLMQVSISKLALTCVNVWPGPRSCRELAINGRQKLPKQVL